MTLHLFPLLVKDTTCSKGYGTFVAFGTDGKENLVKNISYGRYDI